MNNSYKLMSIVQDFAPTGAEQNNIAKLYNEAQENGMHERVLCQMFANILADGLNNGNWPWTINKSRRERR